METNSMVKQTIQIFARIRPTKKPTGFHSIEESENEDPKLEFMVPHDLADGFVNNKREIYKFTFQKVFNQKTKQEEIFEAIARSVADSALSGYNGTIFAYGQTGSGKTFTITGGVEKYIDRGIIPRTLSYLFEQINKETSQVFTMHISYLEIYNENGYDLLDPRHEVLGLENMPKVALMEDMEQNIHLKNLSLHQASNEEEALNLLFLGDTNRMVAETPMNQASTRSHCIFTVNLASHEPSSSTIRHSKLHLVDLAGSERVGKMGLGGQLLTEAKYINLSLHFLEQVITALSEKKRIHIPYRNSMMTSVLRDSLGGNCMTSMIANLSVEKSNIDESISTCRFAQRVALIKNEAVMNEAIEPKLEIKLLKREVQQLKDELKLVTGEQHVDSLSQEDKDRLWKSVQTFIEDTDVEAILDVGADMRKINHCFLLLKQYNLEGKKVQAEQQKNMDEKQIVEDNTPPTKLRKLEELLKQRDKEISMLVLMLKKEKLKVQQAFGHVEALGIPSYRDDSVESGKTLAENAVTCLPPENVKFHSETCGPRPSSAVLSMDYKEAFESFRKDCEENAAIEETKHVLKQRYADAKTLGRRVNESKTKINEMKVKIEQWRMQRVLQGLSGETGDSGQEDVVEEKLRVQIEEEKRK
uniref:Kinesin-like protein n=1 Tax=Eptatretus burgeri TaxID=7764 RepID=A0A8C4NJK3_EPTBU